VRQESGAFPAISKWPAERWGGGRVLRFLAGLLLSWSGLGAAAEGAERAVRAGLATQVNPAGLRLTFEAGWRFKLFRSTAPLLRDAHLAVGFGDQLSPAYNGLEGWAEVSPLSILDLRGGAQVVGFFGTFGHLVAFPGYDADFSDEARKVLRGHAVARVGRRLYASPALKVRIGRASFRASADFEWWKVHDGPGPVFYEPFRGTLLDPDGDSLVAGSNVLLVDLSADRSERVRAGVYHDYLRPWNATANQRQRAGLMAAVKLGKRFLGARDAIVSVAVLDYLEAPDQSGLSAFLALSVSLGKTSRP
jgi:hypothetical protein